jgi:hypothetical protein
MFVSLPGSVPAVPIAYDLHHDYQNVTWQADTFVAITDPSRGYHVRTVQAGKQWKEIIEHIATLYRLRRNTR